jgi:hypothetical protein
MEYDFSIAHHTKDVLFRGMSTHSFDAPQLPEKFGKSPVVRLEWNTELSRGDI